MRYAFCALVALALGCATRGTPEPPSPVERIAAGAATAAIVADVSVTALVLRDGGFERNPMLGRHPSDVQLIGAAAVGVGLNLFGPRALWPKNRKARIVAHLIVFAVEGAVTVYALGQL